MKAASYLHFKDNAREVIKTYQAIFDAEVICEYHYDEDMTQDPTLIGQVFHAEMKIGDLNFYLADSGVAPVFESVKFVVETGDEIQAHRYFEKLTQEGKVIYDFTKMPFGPTIAEVEDRFGVKWDVVIC